MSNRTGFRGFLALVAAAIGVLICLYQGHFTLQLAHPATFLTMLQHRCGMVLVGGLGWAAIEFADTLTGLLLSGSAPDPCP